MKSTHEPKAQKSIGASLLDEITNNIISIIENDVSPRRRTLSKICASFPCSSVRLI